MSLAEPSTWLLLVAGAHLGFQLTVDRVVYPALSDVPSATWRPSHERHSRRIVPVVALIYPPLVLAAGWALVVDPNSAGAWLAAFGGVLSVVTTAALAAPLHGRLAGVPAAERRDLMSALRRADRVRTVGAVVCVVGAVLLAM
jgi:drug/metabolite transporter superfamily protein YnfA